jgi:hypothetical protein
MSFIRNEQYKLTAGYVNSMAIAFVAVGGLAPAVALATQTFTGEGSRPDNDTGRR